jgi:signal transduction histidine kinase/CheY-like chemotaxis protein
MKTRTLIWLISLAAAFIFVVLSFIYNSVLSSKNDLLLKEGMTNLKQESGKVYSLKTQALEQYVFDNSFWDELLAAVSNKDSLWIRDNVVSSARKFEVDCLWLMDEHGEERFFNDNRQNTHTPLFDIPRNNLLSSLKKSPFKTFHILHQGRLMQLVTAPIQPSNDDERSSPHRGYFVGGRYFDSAYTAELNLLSEKTVYSIAGTQTSRTDTLTKAENLLRYYYPLNDFYGKPVSYIRTEKKLSFISLYSRSIKIYLLTYLGLVGLVLLAFYQFLRLRVLKPLNTLSISLQTRNTGNLKFLIQRKDEFADFAKLVEDSFEQNELLKKEVDARKESEAALKKSATELEIATIEKIRAEQDRLAKAEFLSTMSHEIRTPINGVIGIANLLKDEPLTPHQAEMVGTLLFSSNHLLSILTDILDFSKIESGNVTFDRVSFNLRDICNSVHNLYESKAKEKNIDLFVLSDDRVMGYMVGDSVRLCQVLNNLVSNAIKFTEEGSVTFKYRMLHDEGVKQTIEFTVQDTGIGIPADKLDTIFEGFTQANRTINTNYGGTGLGLTITKKIIELQGGKISVVSKPGKGSTFTFFLTFDKLAPDAPLPIVLQKKPKSATLTGLKVLVAEDNKINAMVLVKFLEKWEVEMHVAVNGQEALNKLQQEHYDMVLMDLHMPIMDGMEATKQIRQHHDTTFNKIPVIALTADATSETQKYILENGFDHYLSKPFNPDNLYRLLEQYHQPVS